MAATKKKATRTRGKRNAARDSAGEPALAHQLAAIDSDEVERRAIRAWRDALSRRLPTTAPSTEATLLAAIRELRKAAPAARKRIEELEREQERCIALLGTPECPRRLRGQSAYTIKQTLDPRIEVAKRVAALAGRRQIAPEANAARELIDALKAERDILSASEMHGRGVGLAGAVAVVAAQRRGARRHSTADGERAWLLHEAGFTAVEIAERLFPGEAGNVRGRVNQLLHRHRLSREKQKRAEQEFASRMRAAERKRRPEPAF